MSDMQLQVVHICKQSVQSRWVSASISWPRNELRSLGTIFHTMLLRTCNGRTMSSHSLWDGVQSRLQCLSIQDEEHENLNRNVIKHQIPWHRTSVQKDCSSDDIYLQSSDLWDLRMQRCGSCHHLNKSKKMCSLGTGMATCPPLTRGITAAAYRRARRHMLVVSGDLIYMLGLMVDVITASFLYACLLCWR